MISRNFHLSLFALLALLSTQVVSECDIFLAALSESTNESVGTQPNQALAATARVVQNHNSHSEIEDRVREGVKNRNLAAIEDAVTRRPSDLHYRTLKIAMLRAQGQDPGLAMDEALGLAQSKNPSAGRDAWENTAQISYLESLNAVMATYQEGSQQWQTLRSDYCHALNEVKKRPSEILAAASFDRPGC